MHEITTFLMDQFVDIFINKDTVMKQHAFFKGLPARDCSSQENQPGLTTVCIACSKNEIKCRPLDSWLTSTDMVHLR